MRSFVTTFVLLAGCVTLASAQLPPQAPTAAAPVAPAPVSSFAQTLQPALGSLTEILPTLRPDKWKISADLRRRNADNVASIQGDISSTLPGLLSAADAAPASLPLALAVTRNLDALYDVVLRVAAAAEIGAPDREAASLSSALASLGTARQRVDERLRSLAAQQQQQLTDLGASLQRANAALATATASLQSQAAAHPTTKSSPRTKHRTQHTTTRPTPAPTPAQQ